MPTFEGRGASVHAIIAGVGHGGQAEGLPIREDLTCVRLKDKKHRD